MSSWFISLWVLTYLCLKSSLWGWIQRKTCWLGPCFPELTITSPYVKSRIDSNTSYHGQPYARVDLNPMPESTLFPNQRDLGFVLCAGIFKQSMGARNRVGIGLSYYRPARLHSLAEWVPWNRFLGSLKSLNIRALFSIRVCSSAFSLSHLIRG